MSKDGSKGDNGSQYSYGNAGYDGRYGSYYNSNSYGTGYYGEGTSNMRGFADYLAMFRERLWWMVISLFICIVSMGFYCMNATPVYTSVSSLQVLRQQSKTVEFNQVSDSTIRTDSDFNTEVTIIEGLTIAQNVDRRLKESERRQLMAPYLSSSSVDGNTLTPVSVLMRDRKVTPRRMTFLVYIEFSHPNRDIAARIANLFAEEYIGYKRSKNVEAAMRAVDELQAQINIQARKVNELEVQLTGLMEKYKTTSFDSGTDMNQRELLRITEFATEDKRIYDEINSTWQLIEKARDAGRDLWEIPVVAQDPRVPPLLMRRTDVSIELARLSKTYREKHPKMMIVLQQKEEIDRQLASTVDSVVEGMRNRLENARRNYESSVTRLAQKQNERIELEKLRPEYERLRRDLEGARAHYDYLYTRKQQTMAMSSDDSETARIVDYAVAAIKPSSPRVIMNMAISVFLGFMLGTGIIIMFVLLDDKVKSAFDIEKSLNLNIIGVVPKIGKFIPQAKSRIAASGAHQPTLEAFRSIHSSIQLHDEGRNAKVVLVTSSIPGEGKSFVTTNLSLTYASRGEKVLILDGDFRMPNVAKSLELDNSKGTMGVLDGKLTLDEAIQRDVERNCDVLPTGGSTSNPPHILCSGKFDDLIRELRNRYDRIFIDSPPLAPVSDALNLIHNADGLVYVIRFNTVRRKVASMCLNRLKESKVPVLGAVLNNISNTQTVYYYSHYYSKDYSSYYVNHREKPTAAQLKGGKAEEAGKQVDAKR